MAADTSHLEESYARQAKARVLATLLAINLTNRNYEGVARGSSKVYVTTPRVPTDKASDIGRDGDWPAATEITTDQDTILIDQDPAKAARIPWLDEYDVPANLLAYAAFETTRALTEYVDNWVLTQMINGAAAARKTTLGDQTNYLPNSGKQAGNITTGSNGLIDWLKDQQTELQNENLMDTGTVQYRHSLVTNPAGFRIIRDWLLDNDQEITRDWKNEIVRTSGLVAQQYRYSLFDFDIYVNTAVPTSTISSKAHANFILSNPMAMTMAFAPPLLRMFNPANNQVDKKAGWRIEERYHYGGKVIDDRFLRLAQVRTEA